MPAKGVRGLVLVVLLRYVGPWVQALTATAKRGKGLGNKLAGLVASVLGALWFAGLKMAGGKRPKTFDFQDALPSLPVPPLADTCAKYAASVAQLATSDDEAATTRGAIEAFAASPEAAELQRRLVQRATSASGPPDGRDHSRNWLEQWWLEYAYLRGRDPLAINVSFYAIDNMPLPPPVTDAASRAAGLVTHALAFKRRIDEETLPPTRQRGVVPVDMYGYSLTFGTNRTPHAGCDTLDTTRESKHITVYYRPTGTMYILDVDGIGGSDGTERGTDNAAVQAALRREFLGIMRHGASDGVGGPHDGDHRIVHLTSDNRDTWAAVREDIRHMDGDNRARLARVERSLFTVVLDTECEVATLDDTARHLLLECETWYDSCFTLHIWGNGHAAITVEHTYTDAPVASHLWEHCLANEAYDTAGATGNDAAVGPAASGEAPRYEHLDWDIDGKLSAAIRGARERHAAQAGAVAVATHVNEAFGKDVVKRMRLSPDAFVQMALQVASLRYFGHPVLTYEAGATRMYYHGRTECIRSVSNEAVAFAEAIVDRSSPLSKADKLALLRTACRKHVATAAAAVTGAGVDRHMLGLKLMALESTDLSMPPVFSDPAFQLGFRLSTSQTPIVQENTAVGKYPPDKQSRGGGFGPVAEDGVGVAYFIVEHQLRFFVSANRPRAPGGGRHDCAAEFAAYVGEAVRDMAALGEA